MSVCPFCKSAVPSSSAPCPSCGRRAEDHPSLLGSQGSTIGGGWDDEDLAADGSLPLSPALGAVGPGNAAASAYSGGGLGLGDDDDPFADDATGGALELDLPQHHTANAPRTYPSAGGMPAVSPRPHPSTGGMPAVSAVAVPDLALPPPNSRGKAAPATASLPASPPAPPNVSRPPLAAASPTSLEPPSPAGTADGAPPSTDSPPSPPVPPAPPPPPSPAAMIARYPAPPAKVWETPVYAVKVLLRQFELRQDLASLRKRRSPDVPLYEAALKTHDAKTFALGLALGCAGVVVLTFLVFLRVILRFMED